MGTTGSPVLQDVTVRTRDARLPGVLAIPRAPMGVIVFAHGSGSSRHSPRNRMVSARLMGAGFATLLFDLLDPVEAQSRDAVFDVPTLAERLEDAAGWVRSEVDLPLGFMGASTGAAAALVAAAALGEEVRAVVSRGGRPDLAASRLPGVSAPTLLLVGGDDMHVLELNRAALEKLTCVKALEVVPGATHLFEEPGTLERVADSSADWFRRHLSG